LDSSPRRTRVLVCALHLYTRGIMATCGDMDSGSGSNQEQIKKIERIVFVNQRIQQRLQKDLIKYEDDLRKAQMEGNREQEGSFHSFIRKTEISLSQTSDKLSSLHSQLDQLKKIHDHTTQAKPSDLGETRWRLAGKQMFDVCRDQKMQQLVSAQFCRLHGAILHTMKQFDLRTIQFKIHSGCFKGRFFSTIFRYCPRATVFLLLCSIALLSAGEGPFFQASKLGFLMSCKLRASIAYNLLTCLMTSEI